MGTNAPTIVTLPVRCAPKEAPCPHCGKPGRRKRTLPPRRVRTVAHKAVAYLAITGGEYRARCHCGTTFRNTPDGVLPRALYDNTVRDLVLERIIEDGMSIERTLQSLRRELLLDLSTGFVYDLLRDRAAQLDLAEHRRMVLDQLAAPSASMSCTWAGSRSCWPPTRSATCRWPSPWSAPMTTTTCGGSSATSRPGG